MIFPAGVVWQARHLIPTLLWIFLGIGVAEPLNPSEWRYFSPILSSQVRSITQEEANELLGRICEKSVHFEKGIGLTCITRPLGLEFEDIVDRRLHPKAVVLGHFLSPNSSDAAVSVWSAETHPQRWGATLLLSNRDGVWVPIWYRSGLIIDACAKVALPNSREVLLCEDEDSGMGHAFHYLYQVDLEHPSDLERTLLAKAESYQDLCGRQQQELKRLQWRSTRQGFSVEVETALSEGSNDPNCGHLPKVPVGTQRLTFVVTTEGLGKTGDTQ